MYKMKMRIALDVTITTDDSHKAFELLENVKYNLERAKVLPSCVIRNVHTDAMLSEETFEPVIN